MFCISKGSFAHCAGASRLAVDSLYPDGWIPSRVQSWLSGVDTSFYVHSYMQFHDTLSSIVEASQRDKALGTLKSSPIANAPVSPIAVLVFASKSLSASPYLPFICLC